MKLDIKFISDDAYNCIEMIFASLALYWKKNFELIGAESWGFTYKSSDVSLEIPFGEKIDCAINYKNDYLEKYHGIQVTFREANNYIDIVEAIKEKLKDDTPVCIYIDTYWCPWFVGYYKKIHSAHYCLVTGIDESNNLFCKDALAKDGEWLSLDHFSKGFKEYIDFRNLENYTKCYWKEIVRDATLRLKDKHKSLNVFDEMRLFAKDLRENLHLSKEVRGYEDRPFQAKIYKKLFNISRGRKVFSKALLYVSDEYRVSELKVLADLINKAGNKWSGIFGMLCKSYYIKDNKDLINRIVEKIKDVADEEEIIADTIIELCMNESFNISYYDIENVMDTSIQLSEFKYINLSEYMNNIGFSDGTLDNCKAEISSEGRFFLINGLPINNLWMIDNMKFMFPNTGNNKLDNISCMGQNIKLDICNYRYVMVLGCAELGNHSEKMLVEFEDGYKEEIPLEFTSWLSCNRSFNEVVAWEGKGAVRTNTGIKTYPFSVYLYAKGYQLKNNSKIYNIQLPLCPNIHVFAITLGR
ncbi:BtrH N-terminal domain-containing protein [Alkaliphilus peptidifermentans]|uniref:Butirosin biosynthesis protein H, N-terminal n=1 Tax=Alkaliphilus peptidifermentans DSM 18978 TaxID=1120976 RepID=A0A1G5LAX4_9FIRM|nr:BtrH N-terminal domain-containing protein [Alkaliphilus peptidifermentans]SCZ09468.1 Butirosin biosynthesis protein H, N-terminal [Alkaliphilus peptidifermentans DSM 18978]